MLGRTEGVQRESNEHNGSQAKKPCQKNLHQPKGTCAEQDWLWKRLVHARCHHGQR